MKRPLILLIQSLKRVRTLVLAMALLLAAFQILLILVAGPIQRSGSFQRLGDMLPSFVREVMGPSLTAMMSFGGIVCLGYFHLAVIGSLVGLSIAIGTMPTSEIETGFMDLILSRPLPRHWIITRSIVVMIICAVAVLGMMMIGTSLGLYGLAPRDAEWPASGLIWNLVINLGALMLCWNSVAMAIGAGSRRRSVAGGVTGLLALAMFLLDYVARAWEPAAQVGWLSPFRYYSPFELLMGNALPAKNLLVLAGIAVSGFSLAYILFSRRDISH
jgi:ABC-2 type transport system permease protein